MFFVLIGATITAYIGVSSWTKLNGNYDEISRRLYAHPKICNVKLWTMGEGLADLATDVAHVEFGIVGRPGTRISISVPKTDIFTSANGIALSGIGDIGVHASHYFDSGASASGSIDIGPDSKLSRVLPCTVTNLDELIDNYDKLLAGLSKWPQDPQNGVIEITPTERIEYWATRYTP